MQCSDCKTEMEKGWTDGIGWILGDLPILNKPLRPGVKEIISWRCPSCGEVKLYTSVEKST